MMMHPMSMAYPSNHYPHHPPHPVHPHPHSHPHAHPHVTSNHHDHDANPQVFNEEARSLIVFGLPFDVKTREVMNLMRQYPGFELATIKEQPKGIVAFVTFSKHSEAMHARGLLQGYAFDTELNAILKVDFTRFSTLPKRPRDAEMATPFNPTVIDKRLKHSMPPAPFYPPPPPPPVEGFEYPPYPYYPPPPTSVYPMPPPPPHYIPYAPPPPPPAAAPAAAYSSPHHHHPHHHVSPSGSPGVPSISTPVSSHSSPRPVSPESGLSRADPLTLPESSTLFVSNMKASASQEELESIFKHDKGFKKLSVVSKGLLSTCWVEFFDHSYALASIPLHHGKPAPSSLPGGLRVTMAKVKPVPNHSRRLY